MIDFPLFSKTLKSFGTELHRLRGEIEDLERKREDVLYAPACRADVSAALEAWIARARVKHQAHLGAARVDAAAGPGIHR